MSATQYPKKENIPTTLLAQSRRVGLPVPNRIASQLIIDSPGLETFSTPGRGLISQGKGYRGNRAFFVRVPDDKSPDLEDDRAAIYSRIPRKGGVAPLDIEADVPPTVEHGPTFTSAPPPSPEGLWVSRVTKAEQQQPAADPQLTLDELVSEAEATPGVDDAVQPDGAAFWDVPTEPEHAPPDSPSLHLSAVPPPQAAHEVASEPVTGLAPPEEAEEGELDLDDILREIAES